MSLVGTLAKLAVGYAAAQGMKSVIGGGAKKSGGGIGDLLGSLTGGSAGASTGGLGDLLGGLTGGKSGASGGGLGDLLGQLGGGAAAGGAAGGLGGLLTDALSGGQQDVAAKTTQDDEAAAGLMIRAMLQAAKSDGRVDEKEKAHLMDRLGDLDEDEVAFINAEMARNVDVRGLAADVPNGMEQQVYMMSLMGIDLDSQNEAQYLNDLAGAMNLGQDDVNQIHSMLGVQSLYS